MLNNKTYLLQSFAGKGGYLTINNENNIYNKVQTIITNCTSPANELSFQWVALQNGSNINLAAKKNLNYILTCTDTAIMRNKAEMHKYAAFGQDNSEQQIEIINLPNNLIRIYLPYRGLYLQAKSPESKSEIFWANYRNDENQLWLQTDITTHENTQITVTDMPYVTNYPYPQNTEHFHPQSDMCNGSFYLQNYGQQKIVDKLINFYTITFGIPPQTNNNFLFSLYGCCCKLDHVGRYNPGTDLMLFDNATIVTAFSGKISVLMPNYLAIDINENTRVFYVNLIPNNLLQIGTYIKKGIAILGTQSGKKPLNFQVHKKNLTNHFLHEPCKPFSLFDNMYPTVSPYNYM